MSGTEPAEPAVPPVLLPGEAMDAFISSIARLVPAGPVIIDTFPIEPDDLPDEPKDRLFVCAHRYAYETATAVAFVGDTNRITVRVATVEGLIAMKAHALRFGRPERRRRKRASDLYDVVRLTTSSTEEFLVGAPWDLRTQVRAALAEDLADLPAAAAALQG